MERVKPISPWQFTAFRIALGIYLAVHFLYLLQWAGELFSAAGLLPDARANFTFGILPNPLEHFDTPEFVQGFIGGLAVLSVLFACGIWRRTAALLLWFGWACLFNRNNLISNPGIPYIGLLLVLSALVPTGEPLSARRPRDSRWQMPAMIYWGAWFLLVAGYTYSGAWKLLSPSWLDGSALHHLLTNPLARPGWARDVLLQLPSWMLQIATWIALAGELLALPLSLTRRGRMISWLWMLAMHISILFVVDFADLTFGMIMIHLFTFDPKWLPSRQTSSALVLFDGDCALCQRTVQFLLAEDTAGVLRFAPLQGQTAAPILRRHWLGEMPLRTMVLVQNLGRANEVAHTHSEAALRALDILGGFWRVISWMRLIPRPLRDLGYNFIAGNRYRWFGHAAECQLPSPEIAARLLP